MHSKVNKLVRSLTGAVLVASVAVASFTGCTTGQTEYTDGMRDGNDINTFETTEETEPEATPTPTNTPTPTPSPTPAIPHMDMPDVDTTAPFFLTLPESVSIENGSEFDINRHIGYIDDCDSNVDLQIDEEVDTSEDGSYALSLTIIDDAAILSTDIPLLTSLMVLTYQDIRGISILKLLRRQDAISLCSEP